MESADLPIVIPMVLCCKNMEDNCSQNEATDYESEATWTGPRYTIYHYRFTIDVLSIGHIIIGILGVVLFIVEVSATSFCLILAPLAPSSPLLYSVQNLGRTLLKLVRLQFCSKVRRFDILCILDFLMVQILTFRDKF